MADAAHSPRPGGRADLLQGGMDDVAEQQGVDAGERGERVGRRLDPQQAHQEELPGAGGQVLELGDVEVAQPGLPLAATGDPADEAEVGAQTGARRPALGGAEVGVDLLQHGEAGGGEPVRREVERELAPAGYRERSRASSMASGSTLPHQRRGA